MHYKTDAGRISGMFYLTGAFSLAGTSVIAARLVSGYLGTFTITAASLLFAVASLLPFCLSGLKAKIQNLTLKEWAMLLLQAVFGIFLFRLFLLQGLQRTSAGESGILTGATPAITALLSVLILREPMYKMRFIGLVITIAGIMMVQGVFLPFGMAGTEHFFGNLLVICAAACESLFNVLSRFGFASAAVGRKTQLIDGRNTRRIVQIDPILQTLLVSFVAFLLCLIPAAAEKPLRPLMSLGPSQWLALLWYGVIVTAVAFYFWYEGIKRSEASVAAVFSGMMPFTALLLSVLILGERPAWQQYSGAALIIAEMVISGFSRKSADTGIPMIQSSGESIDCIDGTKNCDPAPSHL
ncbi:MAG TPA: DMT family transporter [Clostridia bacterium]|nr:DMT family transporter [Clostridia bacterium]